MQIRPTSLLAIAYVAAALVACDGPTAVEETFSPSFAAAIDPNAPANLTATAVFPPQINLAWTAKSHNETGFQIFRSSTGTVGSFSLLATTPANVTTYGDAAIQPGPQLCYYVQSIAKNRVIGTSSTTCVGLPVPPGVSTVLAMALGTGVSITWADNSLIESGFRVESAAGSAGPWTTSGDIVVANGGNALRTAPFNTQVCYRVVAFNGYGDAPPSGAACVTPQPSPTLTATADGQYDREIRLRWTDNATEETYELSRSTSGGPWQVINVFSANTTEYFDYDLTAGTTYSYRIVALKGSAASVNSAEATATATAANGRPRGPANVYTYVYSPTGIQVYWDIPYGYFEGLSNVTGWRVEKSVDPFSSWDIVEENNVAGYYLDDGISTTATICYRITAKNSFGESDPSTGYYNCASTADYYECEPCYCDVCDGGNSAARPAGVPSLLDRLTPLLRFGPAKSAVGPVRGAKTLKRAQAPWETQQRKTR
ncbi:MAG: hypothetical protein ACJ793_07920 [Gemmatimonadaceae bacterium]